MSSSTIYLICGSTGAGKTTYAIRLSETVGAVRFSIDEWMVALFWMDTPKPIESGWAMERVNRCYNQILATTLQVAKRGTPCVLDLGFGQRRDRTRFAELARAAGFSIELHLLAAPIGRPIHSSERRPNGITPSRAPELILFVRATGKPDLEGPRSAIINPPRVCLSSVNMNSAVLFGLASALGYGVTDYIARIAGRAVGVWRSLFYGDLLAFIALSAWFLIVPESRRFTFAGHIIAWAASVASAVILLVSAAVLTRGR